MLSWDVSWKPSTTRLHLDFEAVSFHGVAENLATGSHYAELQFKVNAGSIQNYYEGTGTHRHAHSYMRLSAIRQPSDALSTTNYLPTNLKDEGSSANWASLPGVDMKTNFDVTNSESVLLYADISFVRHDTLNKNTFFRIIVDDDETKVYGYSNTGNSIGADYASLSFHGFASGLSVGSHTAELQVQNCGH